MIKRYLRACCFTNAFDFVVAFVSTASIGLYSMALCAKFGHQIVVSQTGVAIIDEIIQLIQLIVALLENNTVVKSSIVLVVICAFNYWLVLRINPKRWVLSVFLLVLRFTLSLILMLIVAPTAILSAFHIYLKNDYSDSARKSKDLRYTKANREKAKNESYATALFIIIFGGLAGICWKFVNLVTTNLFRSRNTEYSMITLSGDLRTEGTVLEHNEKESSVIDHSGLPRGCEPETALRETEKDMGQCGMASSFQFYYYLKTFSSKYKCELILIGGITTSVVCAYFTRSDAWLALFLLSVLGHVLSRGFTFLRDGWRTKTYLRSLVAAVIVVPLFDLVLVLVVSSVIDAVSK